MKGRVFRRCTQCPSRSRYPAGDRRCPSCGATTFTWYFSVDVGKRADGKRRRIDRGGFQTKRDAERAMRELLSKADRGHVVEPSSLTVAEFLRDEWLPSMEMTIARTTWEGYRGNIERYIAPRIGAVPLADLQPTTINRLYADVRTNGRIRGDGPLSLKSVREVHVTLHRALEDAVRWDYLDTNPARRANAPSATAARNARKKAIQTWTAEQVLVFATMHRDHEFFPLWLLAASTGMRRSELLGLRWRDIDLEGGRLAVRQSLVLVAGRPEFKDAPKSAYGFRTIRIPDHAVSELMKLRRSQMQSRLESPAWHELDLVFCRPDGLPWHPDSVTKTVRDMVADSGLPRIRPLQDLRHTHATLLLADGANPKVIQERLGHHSHSFTADTYQHTMPGMDDAVATQFDDLVFGNDENDRKRRPRGRR